MYATNMYCMDLKERMGNASGRLVYIVPVLRLTRAANKICHGWRRFLQPVGDCQRHAGLG